MVAMECSINLAVRTQSPVEAWARFLGLETAGFILAYDGSSTSTYSLSGGALAVTGAEVIGFYGSGTFTQSAGTNTIAGGNELDLGVGYDGLSGVGSGTYTLSGGTAYVSGNVYVGGSSGFGTGGSGSLIVNENSGASLLTVVGALKVFPGNSLSLDYGEIKAGTLDLGGNYAAFNWYLGTLDLTNTNVVLDASVVGPTNPLGSSLTITSLQTFIVNQNETIGGVGPGSLTINGSHIVGGMLTLTPEGTLTVNSGGSLSYTSFVQQGGIVSGTIINTGSYTYQGGLFNGRLVNQGTASLGNNFTAGNGIENDTSMSLASGQKLTVNGAGFDNLGSLTMSGGNIGGSGSFTNDYGGLMSLSGGIINQSVTNNGALTVSGVASIGGGTNYGQITLSIASNIRAAGFASPLINEAGGIVLGNGGAITLQFLNAAGGNVEVPAGASLSFVNGWNNEGFVSMGGANALLNGGPINNTATIQGAGQISPAVTNSGLINATAGS